MVQGRSVEGESPAGAEEVEVSRGAEEPWRGGQRRSTGAADAEGQGEEGHLLGPAQAFYRPCNCLVCLYLLMVLV